MVARGETIGRAVVKIIADGAGFGKSVERELEKSEGPIGAAGGRHSDAYSKEFNKRMSQSDIGKGLRDSLEKGIAKSDIAQSYFNSRDWNRFRGVLRKRFGDEGVAAADSLAKEFAHNLGGIDDAVEGIMPRIEKMRRDIESSGRDANIGNFDIQVNVDTNDEALAQFVAHVERVRAQIDASSRDVDLGTSTIHVDVDTNEGELDSLPAHIERIRAMIEAGRRDMDLGSYTIHVDVDRDSAPFSKLASDIDGLGDHVETFGQRFRRIRDDLKNGDHVFTNLANKVDDLADGIGRAFGKGSRSEALNVFGRLIEGAVKLTGVIPNVAGRFQVFGRVLRNEMGKGTGIFDSLSRGVGVFAAALGPALAALPAAAAGFITLSLAIGTVVAALSALAGAITAVAGSISFGLIGALAPIAGLLGPIVVGAGAVAAAFIGMNKQAKKAFKDTIAPMKDLLKQFGAAARPGILAGFSSAFERLSKFQGSEESQKLFIRLTRLAKTAGDAVGNFFDKFAVGIRGPGLGQFITVMNKTMPSTLGRLGRIFGNTMEGILGVIATLNAPGGPVSQLLVNVDKITKAFAKWSVSPDAISFFDKATTSAQALWDVVSGISDVLLDLLGTGQKVGDSLMFSLGGALHDIDRWMDSAKGQTALKGWFNDAEAFARALGRVAEAAFNVLDALDSPTTRTFATAILNLLVPALNGLAGLITFSTSHLGSLAIALGVAGGAALIFGSRFAAAKANISTFVGNVRNAETRMAALRGAASAAAGVGGLALLMDGFTRTAGVISGFETTVGGALAGFAAGGPIGAAIGGIAGLFIGIKRAADKNAAAVKAAGDTASDSVADWDTLTGTLDENTAAITKNTRAYIYDKLQKDGVLDTLNKYGVASETVIDALTGNTVASGKLAGAEAALSAAHTKNASEISRLDGIIKTSISRGGPWTQRLVAMRDHRDALIKVNQGIENTQQALGAERTALGKDQAALQERSKAVNGIARALKSLPKSTRTELLSNFPKSLKDVENYARSLHLTPKQVRTVVKAFGIDATDGQLKRLIKRLKDTGNQHPKPKVDADDKPISRVLRRVNHGIDAADRRTAKPKVDANDHPFAGVLKRVNHGIDAADRRTGKPKFDADKTRFDSKNSDVSRKVNEANRKHVDIPINADPSDALNGISAVNSSLANMQSEKVITIRTNLVTSRLGPIRGAAGMIAAAPTRMLIGEAGPEAVVPLSRPLSQVDPAVRELSAIAQGLAPRTRFASGGVVGGPSKVVNVGGLTVITPTRNPRAVAIEAVNHLVASGY